MKSEDCPVCKGWGKRSTGPLIHEGKNFYSNIRAKEICTACHGKGKFLVRDPEERTRCNYCNAHGTLDGSLCPVCKGIGTVKMDIV